MPPRVAQKYTEIVHHDLHFKVGDACLINPEPGMSQPFIGKIQEIFQSGPKKEDVMLKVIWYYRPEEAMGGRKKFHGDKELFESDHADEIHKDTIIGKCFVHTLKKYEGLDQVTESDFFTRFYYKPAKKEFHPDQVPVFCICEQPYNPDKTMVMCEGCRDWFHPACVGMKADADLEVKDYRCPECSKPSSKKLRVS